MLVILSHLPHVQSAHSVKEFPTFHYSGNSWCFPRFCDTSNAGLILGHYNKLQNNLYTLAPLLFFWNHLLTSNYALIQKLCVLTLQLVTSISEKPLCNCGQIWGDTYLVRFGVRSKYHSASRSPGRSPSSPETTADLPAKGITVAK